jgi:hypothetical protein
MKNLGILALAALSASAFANSATIGPLTGFGGADGWLAPAETNGWLDTANNTRGFAYNAATGNLIVVSRTAGSVPAPNGPQARILNGSTGFHDPTNSAHFLNQGTGVITGGTFTMSTVAADRSGNIYVANLATSALSAFKVYKWASEGAAAPTVAINQSGFTRAGDSLDLLDSGGTVSISAGGTGYNNLVRFQDSGSGFGPASTFSMSSPFYRIGHTFAGSHNAFFGKQTGPGQVGQSGTISGSSLLLAGMGSNLGADGIAAMDYAEINGVKVLAVMDMNSSTVRIYNVNNPTTPLLMATGNNTSGTLASNTNATGQVKWGAINGGSATLYAMSTNQGIQAFSVNVVPEPATMAALGLGVAAMLRRRKK